MSESALGPITIVIEGDRVCAADAERSLQGSAYSNYRFSRNFAEYADMLCEQKVLAVIHGDTGFVLQPEEALQLLRQYHPGARFLAFEAPVADGEQIDLAALLSEAGPCASIKVVLDRRVSDRYVERFVGMTRKAPMAILELDREARIRYANPAAIQLARRLGLRISEFQHALPPRVEELVSDCLYRTTHFSISNLEAQVNGHTIVWDLEAVRREGVVYAFGKDITLRLRAQADLQKSETNLRRLVESISDIIVRVSRSRAIDYVSPQWEQILGHTAEAAIATPLLQWVEAEDAASVEAALDDLLGGKRSITPVPFRVRHADGSIRYLSASATLVDVADEEHNFVTFLIRDVTEIQHLEVQLRQSQKMEAVGLLAGGVAHDFNNLLTGINGYLELSLMELEPDHAVCADLKQAQSCADRAAELTRQLLTFSRRQEIDPRVLALNDVIFGFSRMLQRVLGESNKLQLHLADDLQSIFADPGQMEQIILNLAMNAKDAMPKGGTFTLTTRNYKISEGFAKKHVGVATGDYVLLEIADTGHGMSAETQERIFEPFFTTRGLKNVGLGLAVTYGIIKQHHGTIAVSSAPNQGTRFKIYLPVSVMEDQKKVLGLAPQGNATILIAEDEKIVRDYATRVLRQRGYNVLTAENATQAKNLINSCGSHIDLLLADVVMPGESGVDLYHWLRDRQPRIKALFMSGYTNTIFEAYLAGVDSSVLMQKPFTSQLLLQKVARALTPLASQKIETEQVH